MQSLFDFNHSAVHVLGHRSEAFPQPVGLLQGSILSPILYALFIDDLAGRLSRSTHLRLGDLKINSFFYADDIALVAESIEEMTELLQVCEEYGRAHGFRFAPQKCEVLAHEDHAVDQLRLYDQQLKVTENFVYLGYVFSPDGMDNKAHVERICGKAMDGVNVFRRIGLHRDGFSIAAKRRIFETFIRPKMEYGLAVARLGKAEQELLERTLRGALMTMFRVSQNTGLVAMCQLAGTTTMDIRAELLRLGWDVRVRELGPEFMIHHARAAAQRHRHPRSVFRRKETTAQMVFNSCLNELTRSSRWDPLRPMNTEERLLLTKKRRTAMARHDARVAFPGQVVRIDATPRLTSKRIDSVPSARGRRLLSLYSLNKVVGEPKPCCRCGARATLEHFRRCLGIDPDTLLNRPIALTVVLTTIAECCLGRPGHETMHDLKTAVGREACRAASLYLGAHAGEWLSGLRAAPD